MSNTLYAIYHEYSVLNNFGAPVYRHDLVGLSYDRNLALEWIKKHDIECVYDNTQYNVLISGSLILRSIEGIPFLTKENFETENPWKYEPWAVENHLCHKAKELDDRLYALPDSTIKNGIARLIHLYPNITDEMIRDVANDILKRKGEEQK